MKKLRKETGPKASRPQKRGAVTAEDEHIISGAATYCLRHFPMLWTTEGLPEECTGDNGARHWIIRLYLRYPTGFEGYLGDLRYDGAEFTELTDRSVMLERAGRLPPIPRGSTPISPTQE